MNRFVRQLACARTRALVAAMCTCIAVTHVSAQGGAPASAPGSAKGGVMEGARRIVDRQWVGIWDAGGRQDDELFGVPRELVATRDGVYVLDVGLLELMAFDRNGRRRWSAGRKGSGPGELRRPVDLTLAPNGDVAVLDPGNSRVAYFAPTGVFRRSVTSSSAVLANAFCINTAWQTHFFTASPDRPFHTVDAKGTLLKTLSFPWPTAPDAPSLVRHALFARGTAHLDCAFATQFGFGVGRIVPGQRIATSPFVESVAPPVIEQERTPAGVRQTIRSGDNAALAVVRQGDTILVAFAGSTRRAHGVIDLYAADGRYLESWKAPCSRFAYSPPWLYCMQQSAEWARLIAFVPASDTARILRDFDAKRRGRGPGAGAGAGAGAGGTPTPAAGPSAGTPARRPPRAPALRPAIR